MMPETDPEVALGLARDSLKMAPPPDDTTGSDVGKDGKQEGRKRSKNYRRRRRTNSFKRSVSSVSWKERKEEARRRRASVRRQSLGLPVAPYNTTQFLMEEHKFEQPKDDEGTERRRRRGDSFNSVDSDNDEFYSSYDEDEEYLHAQFCLEYDNIHNERLHSMSKSELVTEYLILEARIDSLEHELKAVKEAEENDQPMEVQATEEDIAKISVFQQEIDKLQEENIRLKMENEGLRLSLGDDSTSVEVRE